MRMAHADDPWRVADEGTQQAAGSGVIERDLESGCRFRAEDEAVLDELDLGGARSHPRNPRGEHPVEPDAAFLGEHQSLTPWERTAQRSPRRGRRAS